MWTREHRETVGNFGCGRALSDFQWSMVEPLLPPEKPGGRHREVDLRGVLDAIFYVTRTGCTCRRRPTSRRGARSTATTGCSSRRASGRLSATT
jgi:putative transposase